jgi:LPXTG-motif cell wall-anchored protein
MLRLTSTGRSSTTVRALRGLAATAIGALALTSAAPAGAATPAASAFGAQVVLNGSDLVPPTPTASVAAPVGDDSNTLVDVPAAPVAVSGTLIASASAHATADIDTALTVVTQDVPGPYNATAVGQVENLGIAYDVAGQGVALVSAALVRAEAAVVCGATPTYSATSEIVDLAVAGTQVPLNTPVQDLVDAITGALGDTGLNAVVDVQRNVVSDIAGGGIGVDALVVTILAAAGNTPLASVTIGHAEVTAAGCVAPPQCSDGADNDGDVAIDAADPGCHTDGNAANAASYDANDDDETNAAVLAVATPELPRTGGSTTTAGLGIGALALGLGALVLRRRSSLI